MTINGHHTTKSDILLYATIYDWKLLTMINSLLGILTEGELESVCFLIVVVIPMKRI